MRAGRAGAARAGARRDPRQPRLSAGDRAAARRSAGADRADRRRCSRMPSGQLTMQAQTEGGVVELLVCDYRGGELRGYVRHDAERLAERRPNPSLFALFGTGYLAITFDQPATQASAIRASCRSKGESLAEAAQSYFAQSEQIPTLVRLGARARTSRAGSPAACCSSICPRARKAATGCTRGSTIPNGACRRASQVAACATEIQPIPILPLETPLLWRPFGRGRESARAPGNSRPRGAPVADSRHVAAMAPVSRRKRSVAAMAGSQMAGSRSIADSAPGFSR